MTEKKPLKCLFRENPETRQGKYLVLRRDRSVVEWPSFVLGARDPDGANCLRFYGLLKLLPDDRHEQLMEFIAAHIELYLTMPNSQNKEFVESVMRNAGIWDQYRAEHGDGDPLSGPHRVDDPATIAEMEKGQSA